LIYVKVRKGQSIERALSIFKKKVKDSKILHELKEREYYTKPSQLRKEKKARARARIRKIQSQTD
jgi:small subunit ribosomal protein S21|tara:strand:- start:4719 stop:4913 length:195 start_codon:yes stop_codon:yes gene_type:complete